MFCGTFSRLQITKYTHCYLSDENNFSTDLQNVYASGMSLYVKELTNIDF